MNAALTRIDGREYVFEYEESIWPKDKTTWKAVTVFRVASESDSCNVELDASELIDLWLDRVWRPICQSKPKVRLYLFASSLTGVDPTPLNRHKGLWSRLKKDVVEVSALRELCEVEFNEHGKIRYAGLSTLSEETFGVAFRFLRNYPAAGVFGCDAFGDIDCDALTRSIYTSTIFDNRDECLLNWPNFVSSITERGGIAVRLFGPPDFGGLYLDTFMKTSSVQALN